MINYARFLLEPAIFSSTSVYVEPERRHKYVEDTLVVDFDIPGVVKEDVDLKLEEGILTLTAKRNGLKYPYKDRVRIPSKYKADPEAILLNGVLTLKFKASDLTSKSIPIS